MYVFMHTVLLIVCKCQDYDGAGLFGVWMHAQMFDVLWAQHSDCPKMEFTELLEGIESLCFN